MAKKAKEKKGETMSLETLLWNCRVALRGVGTTEKNRDAVISLVFLKFAGDKFEKQRQKITEEYPDMPFFLEKVQAYSKDNVFYLNEATRWSHINENSSANDIALILDKAMADIVASNKSLTGALPQKLFTSLGAEKSKLKSLIDNINQIDESRFQEDDLIGRVYEYFLQAYAASGTKEDGEFYTPASVVRLIAELIEPYSGTVYDPCCGSGGMFVQSLKFIDRHNGNRKKVSILGQESSPETWRLCKMNLAIRGISHNLGEENASTFTRDLHKFKKVDYVMANPPFNLKAWRTEDELTKDPRFAGYSVMPPTSNANYAWILHIINKLDVNHGIAGFLLANGALNEKGVEGTLRKEIIERDLVEAIIVLPRDMFYTTDISVTLWIVNMNKRRRRDSQGREFRDRRKEVLFMDLRRWDQNIEEITIDKNKSRKKTAFSDEQIAKVKAIYNNWQSIDTSLYHDVPELCKSATLDDIRAKGYSLAPSKYIEFIDHDLDIDYPTEMARIQNEMRDILSAEKESQTMLAEAFKGIGYGIE